MNRMHLYCCSLKKRYFLKTIILTCFFQMRSMPIPSNDIQPVAPKPAVSLSDADIGIQGNWLKKREWLIKINEANSDLQNLAQQTEPTRASFIDSYRKMEAIKDDYYKTLGLEQGKIQEIFDDIARYIEKNKKRDIEKLHSDSQTTSHLQEKVTRIEDSVKNSKQELDQLQLDMVSIDDLTQSLVERLQNVNQVIKTIHDDVQAAQVITDSVWDIIDHNKARDKYYEIKNVLTEKITNSLQFLKEDLFKDFDGVCETIKKQIARITAQIKKLETDGFIIKDRAKHIKEKKIEKQKMQTLLMQQDKEKEKTKNMLKKASIQKEFSFTSLFYTIIKKIAVIFYNWYTWLFKHNTTEPKKNIASDKNSYSEPQKIIQQSPAATL